MYVMCIDEHKLLHVYVEAKWERVLVGAATGPHNNG